MNWKENSINKLNEAKASLGKRTGPNIQWLKEYQDDSKLRVWDYGLKNGIPTMASALNDWECGIACLAGKPNSGKSTILVNMMIGALELNDDVMIVDLTLDDPYQKRFEQYVASMTGLYYQEITTKTDLSPTKIQLKEQAEAKLIKWYEEDRLRTIEAIERHTTEDNIQVTRHFRDPEEILRIMRSLRQEYPERKIVFFLDAWNNLDLTRAKGSSDLSQANYYLAKFQEETNALKIMLMVSAHLRKSEGRSKPTLDDIKGTSDMMYNVVWAGLVVNELKDRTLRDPLVYKENDKLYPAVVIEIPKSKVSTMDGDLIYVLKSGQCTLQPLHHFEYEEFRDKYRGGRK